MTRPKRDRDPSPLIVEATQLATDHGHHLSTFIDEEDLVAECNTCQLIVAVDVEAPGIYGRALTTACA